MKTRDRTATFVLLCAMLVSSNQALAQFSQEGPKLVGSGAVGAAQQNRVSVSADGNTALVGGENDSGFAGAAWVWTRSAGVWMQQGPKLVGSGSVGPARQGRVFLSADGNTALVGGYLDNGGTGAAWVWTRSVGVWTQQGPKLVGSGSGAGSTQGVAVSLSADGNTAVVGGSNDNGGTGAAWVWTRSGGVWTQQGPKLIGSGASGAHQGISVALSADGNTALVGGFTDNGSDGAAWVWTRSAGVWTQQGPKLVGSGASSASQGFSAALSADGNTALVGGVSDNGTAGAVWVWTRSAGVWTQQGSKLVGLNAVGAAQQGQSVSLSADGNTALVGGLNDNGGAGAAWVWTRSGGVWFQRGPKLVGSGAVGPAGQGSSVSFSADGNTALVGGYNDNGGAGAVWVWVPCTYAISLTSALYDAAGGGGTVDVTATAGCDWTAVSNNSGYLHVTGGAAGTGDGTVTYTLDPNVGAPNVANSPRAGTITVAGQTFTVGQTGCFFDLSPTGAAFGSAAGSGSVDIATPSVCQWTVTNLPAWASTTSGGSGTGPGTWQYNVQANGSASARTQGINVAAVAPSFTLTQLSVSLKPLVPGTHSTFTLNDATDLRWMSILAVARRSYCAQLAPGATAVMQAVPTLAVFRADGTTTLGTAGAAGTCFVAPATETALMRVTHADTGARPYQLRVVESTLWTNWFFVGGEYSSFTLLRNTTGVPINATLTWRTLAGTVASTQGLVIPAYGLVAPDARTAVTLPGAISGSVEIGHDGEPQALTGSQTTLSGSTGLSFDTVLVQRDRW